MDSPTYSLARASATATNTNWHQSNASPSENPETRESVPQWSEYVSKTIKVSMPLAMALDDSDADTDDGEVNEEGEGGGDNEDAGSEDADAEYEDGLEDDIDMAGEAGEPVHPYRIRIWGLASSPGGGSTAALISEHSTLRPERACRTTILFGWTPVEEAREDEIAAAFSLLQELTTEGRLWERMYGGGPALPQLAPKPALFKALDIDSSDMLPPAHNDPTIQSFRDMAASQKCTYCISPLLLHGGQRVRCERAGHIFGTLRSFSYRLFV
jgi:hypothetical protein